MSFITKRHIPRRTFLKGTGVTLALPLLDAMVPASTALAQTVAGQPKSRVRRRLLPARHGTRPLGARGRGRTAGQAALHPRVAREGQGPDRRAERSLVAVGRAARGHDGIRSLGRGGVPDGDQAAEDRRLRRDRRQRDDRSAHRAEDRPGDAAAVAAARRARIRTRARATAAKATAARTRTRSRGWSCRRRKTRPCRGPARSRWSSTRRSSSSACSAAARRRKFARSA